VLTSVLEDSHRNA